MRILTVTGTETALTVASISFVASGTSRISALPAYWPTTLRTGQPKLMSMIAAPVLVEPGGLAHRVGVAADELHRDRLLDAVPLGLLQTLARLADHRLAGDHLGHVEP
jgi:hypothetical protein